MARRPKTIVRITTPENTGNFQAKKVCIETKLAVGEYVKDVVRNDVGRTGWPANDRRDATYAKSVCVKHVSVKREVPSSRASRA
jgi:hypothetical protein